MNCGLLLFVITIFPNLAQCAVAGSYTGTDSSNGCSVPSGGILLTCIGQSGSNYQGVYIANSPNAGFTPMSTNNFPLYSTPQQQNVMQVPPQDSNAALTQPIEQQTYPHSNPLRQYAGLVASDALDFALPEMAIPGVLLAAPVGHLIGKHFENEPSCTVNSCQAGTCSSCQGNNGQQTCTGNNCQQTLSQMTAPQQASTESKWVDRAKDWAPVIAEVAGVLVTERLTHHNPNKLIKYGAPLLTGAVAQIGTSAAVKGELW